MTVGLHNRLLSLLVLLLILGFTLHGDRRERVQGTRSRHEMQQHSCSANATLVNSHDECR
jgi:hypothetical protein